MNNIGKRPFLGFIALLCLIWFIYNVFNIVNTSEIYELPEKNLTVVEAIDQSDVLEHPDFIKEDYVSLVPEGINLSQEAEATASSFAQSYTPRKVIDGKTDGVSYWEASPDSYPNILTLDLKAIHTIHAIRLMLNPAGIWSDRDQTFDIQTSMDGTTYTPWAEEATYTFSPDTGNEVILELEAINVRYVRLTFTSNTGGSGAQIAEFEIYGK